MVDLKKEISKFSLLSHSVVGIHFLQRARNEVLIKMTGI